MKRWTSERGPVIRTRWVCPVGSSWSVLISRSWLLLVLRPFYEVKEVEVYSFTLSIKTGFVTNTCTKGVITLFIDKYVKPTLPLRSTPLNCVKEPGEPRLGVNRDTSEEWFRGDPVRGKRRWEGWGSEHEGVKGKCRRLSPSIFRTEDQVNMIGE